MRTLAKEPGRENVEVVSADLVVIARGRPTSGCPVAAPVLSRSTHGAEPGQGADGGPLRLSTPVPRRS
jgi:hypothetical protein